MIRLKSLVFAESTKRSYGSLLHTYLSFCEDHQLPALPATDINIGRYIAYLAPSKTPSSIQQYLTVIRLLHLEFNLPHPLQDNHHITSLLKAVKRDKGSGHRYKLTLSCSHMAAMLPYLNLKKVSDAQLWSLLLACFFGMLRISNVTVPQLNNWAPAKSITRSDIDFHPNGCILNMRWTKTLQFRERVLQTALPSLSSELCPTSALLNFITLAGDVPPDAPAWAYIDQSGQLKVPTPASVRSRLHSLISALGLSTSDFNTHSLRRSGASHLLSAGVPLEVIKILGDWKSDSVFRYLKPDCSQRLSIVNKSFSM